MFKSSLAQNPAFSTAPPLWNAEAGKWAGIRLLGYAFKTRLPTFYPITMHLILLYSTAAPTVGKHRIGRAEMDSYTPPSSSFGKSIKQV